MNMPPQPLSDFSLRSLFKALACEEPFVFLESTKILPDEHRSLVFIRPKDRLVCGRKDDPAAFLARAENWLQQGFYLAGWIGYEFGYLLEPASVALPRTKSVQDSAMPLAELHVFSQPHVFDHASQTFGETGPWPTAAVADYDESRYAIRNLRLNMEEADYLDKFSSIKSYIQAGDTYQVNYTLKFKFEFSGSIPAFYSTLRRNQNVSYAACIRTGKQWILSFSPELFLKKQGPIITVRPMKGTMHRGRTTSEDEELLRLFKNDIKTRSENVMIVDLLRNDLGRLNRLRQPDGVAVKSLFDVETYETLHQMTSTIQGRLRPEAYGRFSLIELFRALFPCGSVTGAPKIRTMQIIRELEKEDRGVYTGAIGYFSPDGDAVLNVPIRTVVLDGKKAEMGIGSGIVYDSDPRKEWEECKLKGRFLTEPAPEFKLIETLLWRAGEGFWLLDLHLDRLADSARYFGYPVDIDEIEHMLQCRADTFVGNRRVRLTLARDGAVDIHDAEHAGPAAGPGTVILPRVMFSTHQTDSQSPYYFHKTTLRRLYDEELRRAVSAGFFEVLFENERGQVTEGSITNIFIKKGGKFITPPVKCGLLAGVFRRHFMISHPGEVEEAILTRQDLERADMIYVCNSVRGMVQVELG